MPFDEIKIFQTRGHWEAHVNGKFYCSGDTYNEVLNEVLEFYYLL